MCTARCFDVAMRSRRMEKNCTVNLKHVFFIFAFFLSLVQHPLKWFSFMYVIIRGVRRNVLLLQIESRMCSCCAFSSSLVRAHDGLELHWLNLVKAFLSLPVRPDPIMSLDLYVIFIAQEMFDGLFVAVFSCVKLQNKVLGTVEEVNGVGKCYVMINECWSASGHHHYRPLMNAFAQFNRNMSDERRIECALSSDTIMTSSQIASYFSARSVSSLRRSCSVLAREKVSHFLLHSPRYD